MGYAHNREDQPDIVNDDVNVPIPFNTVMTNARERETLLV